MKPTRKQIDACVCTLLQGYPDADILRSAEKSVEEGCGRPFARKGDSLFTGMSGVLREAGAGLAAEALVPAGTPGKMRDRRFWLKMAEDDARRMVEDGRQVLAGIRRLRQAAGRKPVA